MKWKVTCNRADYEPSIYIIESSSKYSKEVIEGMSNEIARKILGYEDYINCGEPLHPDIIGMDFDYEKYSDIARETDDFLLYESIEVEPYQERIDYTDYVIEAAEAILKRETDKADRRAQKEEREQLKKLKAKYEKGNK